MFLKIFPLCFVSFNIFSQITINTEVRTLSNLSTEKIEYSASAWNKNTFYYPYYSPNVISSNYNHSGSSIVTPNKDKSKIYCLSLSGTIDIFNTSNGQLIRTIRFPHSLSEQSLKNAGSIFSNMFVLDDNTLILEYFDLHKTNSVFDNYIFLDISGNKSNVESFYGSRRLSEISEKDLLLNKPENRESNAMKRIQSFFVKSNTSINIVKRSDGYYFVTDDFIPLKFVQLANASLREGAKDFLGDWFERNQKKGSGWQKGIKQRFINTLSGEFLLSDALEINGQLYALFGTSFGSKFSAVLVNISDLTKNHKDLIKKAKQDISSTFSKLLSQHKFYHITYDLYLAEKDGSFLLISPRFKQSNECKDCVNVWGNSLGWNYKLIISEYSNYKFPTLIIDSKNKMFFGFNEKNSSVVIYSLSLNENEIDKSKKTSKDNSLTVFDNSLIRKNELIHNISIKHLLTKPSSQELITSRTPSKITKTGSCDACVGTGFVPDKVYQGRIVSHQRNPITGEKIKCMECGGNGKVQYETGEIVQFDIINYSEWQLKDVKIDKGQKSVLYIFNSTKETFQKETRGGVIVKNIKTNTSEIKKYILVTSNGKIQELNQIPNSFSGYESIVK